MSITSSIRSLASRLFRRDRFANDLEEELRSHIEHRADDLVRSGIDRTQAERRARIEFGARERYKEESYRALGGNFLDTALGDTRYAVRVLRKSPGFTFAAIATLALAIGANAVVFSVLNAFILRPLNVPHAESLYGIWRTAGDSMYESYPDYLDLRDRNRSFDSLVAYNIFEAGLDTGENPSRVWIDEDSGNYFDALGLHPYLGRFFHASDERGPNSAPYIVLSYSYWHDHCQNDRHVVGRQVRVNKHPFTIIGVAPPGFHGVLLFANPDFFMPIVNHPQIGGDDLATRGNRWIFMTFGHLKPGVTPAQAAADLNSIGNYLVTAYPRDDAKMASFELARPSLYGDHIGRPVREFMTALMLLAALILLAACANLGSLFAARAADRGREVALRLALGSTRKRILRGLFTEAILISLAGGAFGILGSVVLLRALSAWRPFSRWPLQLSVVPDANVYLVALMLALASGLLFGAVPLRQVLRTNPYGVVKSGSATRTGRSITVRDVLLVIQISICAVLLTSSIVAVRGLARSLHSNFGFEVQNRLMVETDLNMAGYPVDRQPFMQKRMIESVAAIPGVESVGMADTVPLADPSSRSTIFTDNTATLSPANAAAKASLFRVSPEYFQAAGTSLLSGRAFTWQDGKNAPQIAIVNPVFARELFGSVAGAMGGHFKMPDGSRIQVVGVAEDGKYASLTEDPTPVMFVPLLQSPSSSSYMVVHSSHDSEQLSQAIRSKLRELDAGLPLYIQTGFKGLDTTLFAPRMATISLGVLGLMGAVLSITGIFGMAAYSISKRLRELGIRIALGARRIEVLQSALARPVRLLAFGSAAGLALGLLASPVLAFIVYQATPRDPLVLTGVVLAMALLGLLATWLPAHRALSVNPSILLREE